MKMLSLALLSALVCASAYATNIPVPHTAIAARPIAGQLLRVTPGVSCPGAPGDVQCDAPALVTVEFKWSGCMNTLGPVTYSSAHAADGKIDLYISATEITDSRSASTRCFVQPSARVQIPIGALGFLDESTVRAHFLMEQVIPTTP